MFIYTALFLSSVAVSVQSYGLCFIVVLFVQFYQHTCELCFSQVPFFFVFVFFAFFGFVIRSVRVDFVAPPDTSSVHLLGSRRVGVGLNVCGVVLGLSSQFYFYNLFIHVFIILL